MISTLTVAIRMLATWTVLMGVVYPILVASLGQVFFPHKVHGSLIDDNGTIVGSALIGQKFTSDRYFQGRPSAGDYQTLPSSASNLSLTSAGLRSVIAERRKALDEHASDELLTSSGSGLDPHISPKAAFAQVERVARVRGISDQDGQALLSQLVSKHVEGKQLGLFGQARVNVLLLNLAVDKQFP